MCGEFNWILDEISTNSEAGAMWVVLLGLAINYNPSIHDIFLVILSYLLMLQKKCIGAIQPSADALCHTDELIFYPHWYVFWVFYDLFVFRGEPHVFLIDWFLHYG